MASDTAAHMNMLPPASTQTRPNQTWIKSASVPPGSSRLPSLDGRRVDAAAERVPLLPPRKIAPLPQLSRLQSSHLRAATTSLPSVAGTRPQSSDSGRERERRVKVVTTAPRPGPPSRPVLGNNSKRPQARRFNQSGPLATAGQKVRANIELWSDQDLTVPSSHMYGADMDADFSMQDMENMAPSHNLSSVGGGPMELMSMDEFEKANPYTPPPPRRTAPPLRTTSKHGQFSSQFHLACDARGIIRDFVFHMVAQHCYDVELRLNGKFLDRIGQYASHKDAREEICKKHLATVEAMPNQKKRKVSDAAYHPVPAGIDDELWVNLIYGKCCESLG